MKICLIILSMVTLSVVEARKPFRNSRVRSVFYPSETFQMPESCKEEGREFCFDNENYPTEIVEDLLKDASTLVVADKEAPLDDAGPYTDREGAPPFTYDCRDRSENNIIYYIVDEAGKDRVVVQLENRFQQQFSINWCENEGPISGRTEHFTRTVVKRHEMYCQNKYMHYDFLVLSERGYDGNYKIEKARTRTGIPVCCVCRYDKKF